MINTYASMGEGISYPREVDGICWWTIPLDDQKDSALKTVTNIRLL